MCKAENWTGTAFTCIEPVVILRTLPLNFMIPNTGSYFRIIWLSVLYYHPSLFRCRCRFEFLVVECYSLSRKHILQLSCWISFCKCASFFSCHCRLQTIRTGFYESCSSMLCINNNFQSSNFTNGSKIIQNSARP